MTTLANEIAKRITFGIISHPDAGKTTLTEQLLYQTGAIQLAGTVKARKSSKHATSDWMAMEKERGISITTSVMQIEYKDKILNLLDTPGHEDFGEDTYRTLTAVDCALMVIDVAKGVEARTIKLMEICRLRTTPIVTFINKLDRVGKEPIELLDEVEKVLNIKCAPITWPIGMGQRFSGIYHLLDDVVYLKPKTDEDEILKIQGLDNPILDEKLGDIITEARDELELVRVASHAFDLKSFLNGELTPVCFGSALSGFGVNQLLDTFAAYAPGPQARKTVTREIQASEPKFSGFVFKIQANMDPNHRDRVAFLRICSGQYQKGMKVLQARTQKEVTLSQALTFMAGKREHVEEAFAGDIIGLHNHGTIQIGDTFTEGEKLQFVGIPYFAPELFRSVRPKDPMKMKALQKGLVQLSEEGATQVFRPLTKNTLILGAVGVLQFDVVAARLLDEYRVECIFEPVNVETARWVDSKDPKMLDDFQKKLADNLALDGADCLTYLAPNRVNLNLTQDRWKEIQFKTTREHLS